MPTMPSIDAIHLDLTGWTPMGKQPYCWIKPGPDMMSLLFHNVKTGLPCELSDAECWRSHFSEMIANENGAMVSVDVIPFHALPAVCTIFKFHQPKMEGLSDLGITYLGTWMVPLADFSFNIQVQSFEAGTTGMREAAVMLLTPREVPESSEPPRLLKSADEYFDIVRTKPMIRLCSDDEEYDAMFPNHPLSRLRAELRRIAETVRLDDVILNARPYKSLR